MELKETGDSSHLAKKEAYLDLAFATCSSEHALSRAIDNHLHHWIRVLWPMGNKSAKCQSGNCGKLKRRHERKFATASDYLEAHWMVLPLVLRFFGCESAWMQLHCNCSVVQCTNDGHHGVRLVHLVHLGCISYLVLPHTILGEMIIAHLSRLLSKSEVVIRVVGCAR